MSPLRDLLRAFQQSRLTSDTTALFVSPSGRPYLLSMSPRWRWTNSSVVRPGGVWRRWMGTVVTPPASERERGEA